MKLKVLKVIFGLGQNVKSAFDSSTNEEYIVNKQTNYCVSIMHDDMNLFINYDVQEEINDPDSNLRTGDFINGYEETKFKRYNQYFAL